MNGPTDQLPLEPWQERVLVELTELQMKIDALDKILLTDAGPHIEAQQKDLMWRQLDAMLQYKHYLEKRKHLFMQARKG